MTDKIAHTETMTADAGTRPQGRVSDLVIEDMDFDTWREAWFDLCRSRGHALKTDEEFGGGVDNFVVDGGFCNGPGCTKCGWRACMHCDPTGKRVPVCLSPDSADK